MSANLPSISIAHQVDFFDVDSYRIVWHGSYIKYFEIVRCALLDKIDYNYNDMEASGYFFPVVDLQIKYLQPIRFRQQITLTATIKEWQHKLVIQYLIYDRETQQKLTKATTTQVAVAMPGEVLQFESPAILINKINQHLKS